MSKKITIAATARIMLNHKKPFGMAGYCCGILELASLGFSFFHTRKKIIEATKTAKGKYANMPAQK